MAWKANKPASGIPASGIPARGGPARGPGWGGAKSGKPAKEFDAMNQPAPDAKRDGQIAAQTARDVAKAAAVRMARILEEIAEDVTAPVQVRVDAANKIIERAEGKPAQSVDMTSKGEALGGYVIAAPAEAPDADAWAKQHKPR